MSTLLVMKKDGVSYIEGDRWARDSLVVNGTRLTPCPGNNCWGMIEGDVVTVERTVAPLHDHVGWRLKQEFRGGIVKLPEEAPPETFYRNEDGDWAGDHVDLYEPVYRDIPLPTEAVEFEVIDHDCEPVDMPSYVEVQFPANLRYHRAVQHKYPCRIAMPTVFKLVADALVAEAAKAPDRFVVSDFRTIGAMHIDVKISKEPEQHRKRDPWSRRPKWVTVTETFKTVRILDIVGEYREKRGAEQITEIRGANYAELEANLAAYIKGFVDRLDSRLWRVCPHCHGEGVILEASA